MITIRKFEPTDMFAIIKLASLTLPERYNPSLFNFFYETFPQGFIVAEEDYKIIGFIIGVQMNPEKSKILMLSVSNKNRREGIGSALLEEYLKSLLSKKKKMVELEVRVDNNKAIKFYEKHGFKIKKKLIEFYQNQEDAYTMAKEI